MKKILSIVLLFATVSTVNAGKPKVVFQETEYVMTDSYLGQTSEHSFVFKNEGDAPLLISNAVPSCGCVTVGWTKNPVAPGDTGSVRVYYEAKMSGVFHKSVKVYSNVPGKRPMLQISGETKKK